jgi:hypothetical protein
MVRNFFLSVLMLTIVGVPFALSAPQLTSIPQQVIVNGLQAEGVTIVQNGVPQTRTCPMPQPYTTYGSSSGWACYDEANGNWILNAQPPESSGYYSEPPAYEYYGYPTPGSYGYYPFGYGFYGAPLFSFGFGFGGHGHEHGEHFEHGHEGHEGHAFGHEHGGGGAHVQGGGGHGHR